MIASGRLLTRQDCAHAVAFHTDRSAAEILRDAADRLGGAGADVYGAGAALAAFEAKIAAVLGMEAAVFMPSGTMAQQIALRIVADRRALRAFAAHRTNHVVLHERDGFARLHDLAFVAAGSAERLITLDDLRAVHEPVATLLIELPQREIGGELPAWEDLVALTVEARSRGWHLHLDGARLWECGPAYGRPYADIAGLFDTAYVSFYKGIGGIAGAMLAGCAAFIDEARIWQRRHGGNLVTQFPFAATAEQSFDERIGKMAEYRDAARRVAAALAAYGDVIVRPQPPVTNMLHAYIRGDAETLLARAQHVARTSGVWTIGKVAPAPLPGFVRWEISCGDATLALPDMLLERALDGLFGPRS